MTSSEEAIHLKGENYTHVLFWEKSGFLYKSQIGPKSQFW